MLKKLKMVAQSKNRITPNRNSLASKLEMEANHRVVQLPEQHDLLSKVTGVYTDDGASTFIEQFMKEEPKNEEPNRRLLNCSRSSSERAEEDNQFVILQKSTQNLDEFNVLSAEDSWGWGSLDKLLSKQKIRRKARFEIPTSKKIIPITQKNAEESFSNAKEDISAFGGHSQQPKKNSHQKKSLEHSSSSKLKSRRSPSLKYVPKTQSNSTKRSSRRRSSERTPRNIETRRRSSERSPRNIDTPRQSSERSPNTIDTLRRRHLKNNNKRQAGSLSPMRIECGNTIHKPLQRQSIREQRNSISRRNSISPIRALRRGSSSQRRKEFSTDRLRFERMSISTPGSNNNSLLNKDRPRSNSVGALPMVSSDGESFGITSETHFSVVGSDGSKSKSLSPSRPREQSQPGRLSNHLNHSNGRFRNSYNRRKSDPAIFKICQRRWLRDRSKSPSLRKSHRGDSHYSGRSKSPSSSRRHRDSACISTDGISKIQSSSRRRHSPFGNGQKTPASNLEMLKLIAKAFSEEDVVVDLPIAITN